jgi:hypothetical protein
MSMKFAWLAVAACLAVQPALHAQKGKGGKPKPVNIPGVAWFETVADPGAAECSGNAPGIASDSDAPYVGTVTEAGNLGAVLSTGGEFHLTLSSGGSRSLYMNFTSMETAPSGSFFRKNFCERWQTQLGFNTHVLEETGDDNVGLTLLDITPGQARSSRIKVNFMVDDVRFTLRYNNAGYPLSDDVLITRGPYEALGLLDEWSWLIETQDFPHDKAYLHSPIEAKNLRKLGTTDEGSYHMPFRIIFSIPPQGE